MLPISMTYILIGIISVASFIALNNRKFYDAWIFSPYRIDKYKEYYRFLTSGFIHANLPHWFFNVLTFYFSASYIEHGINGLGPFHLVAILLLGMIICDIPTFAKYRNFSGYRSLGASGGVSAVMFAFIMLEPIRDLYVFTIPIPAFIFGGIFLIFSYYQGRGNSGDNINHSAHFYGAVVGIVYVMLVDPYKLLPFFEKLLSWRLPV